MKISIERAVLLKAVSQAQSVVERRNTIPILANVLIEAEGDTVSFRATDLDIEVVDKATAKVERPGATTVAAVTLHEIVRKLPDGALVQLTADGATGRLEVQAGRSNFSLATLPKEDFPVMTTSEYSANFAAMAPVLRRLFDKSKFAISTEETRYYLNGVYLHVSEGDDGPVLRCVATDGHRLARVDAPLPKGADGMPGVIVPRKTVGELRKLLENDETEIAVSVSETKIRFATPAITLTSKVIDGTFPDYSRVIPTGNTRRLEVDAARSNCLWMRIV
jgi:DNA polymerase-3 subunit beta